MSRARRRTVYALFARVTLAVGVLFVRIVHVLFSCVARAVRTRHTLFACVACVRASSHNIIRVLFARCRLSFARSCRASGSRVARCPRAILKSFDYNH